MVKLEILLVDDDEDDFIITSKYLEKSKRIEYNLDWASSYEEAVSKIKVKKYDVILIDYFMGAKTGLDLIVETKHKTKRTAIIILTGQKNSNVDTKALELGAMDYLVKDQYDAKSLERSIIYSVEKKKFEKNSEDQARFKQLIFDTIADGILVVDMKTNKITEINDALKRMLNLDGKLETLDLESIKIAKYSSSQYTNDTFPEQGIMDCFYPNSLCPCVELPREVSLRYRGISKDCLMSCKKIEFENGELKTYKLITLVDISRQKQVENDLIETQNELKELMKKYGIKTKKKNVLLDLLNFELKKTSRIFNVCAENK